MPPQLHHYPKTFNSWASIRALPIRQPIKYPLAYLTMCTLASLVAFGMFKSFGFDYFNRADALQKDVHFLL